MNLRGRRTLLVLCALFAVLSLGGAGWWWRGAQMRDRVVSVLPARPDLNGFSAELEDRLEKAEQRARSPWTSVAGLSELARLYRANGFTEQSAECECALLELDPSNPLWPHLRAHSAGGLGALDEALPLLERTVQLAPGYLPAQVRLGDMRLKRNEFTEAAAAYQSALSRQPDNGYAILGLARMELATGHVESARRHLQTLVREKPQFTAAWNLLINIDERLGDQKSAAAHRAQAAAAGRPHEMPDPWVDGLMSDCYDAYRLTVAAAAADPANGQARARQLLERAIEVAPNNDLPFRLLGNLLSDLGELSAARGYLERATVLNPKNPDNWSYLVKLLKGIGDTPAANRALDAGLSHCPEAPVLHLERGRRFAAAGQLDAAALAFQRARQLRPEDASAPMELAGVYFRQNLLELGVSELHNVVKIEASHPVATVLLARYAIGEGDEAGARKWIARARANPRLPPGDLNRVSEEFRAQFGRTP